MRAKELDFIKELGQDRINEKIGLLKNNLLFKEVTIQNIMIVDDKENYLEFLDKQIKELEDYIATATSRGYLEELEKEYKKSIEEFIKTKRGGISNENK